jgi:hypothetical protein
MHDGSTREVHVFAESIILPKTTSRVRIFGAMTNRGLMARSIDVVHSNKKRATVSPSQTRTLLTVVVHLDGVFNGTVFTNASNTATQSDLEYYWWNRPFNLNQMMEGMSRGLFSFDRDFNKDSRSDFSEVGRSMRSAVL